MLHAPTAPAVTQAELAAAMATAAGTRAKFSAIPGWALAAMGRVSGSLREAAELGYQVLGGRPVALADSASKVVHRQLVGTQHEQQLHPGCIGEQAEHLDGENHLLELGHPDDSGHAEHQHPHAHGHGPEHHGS